MFYERPDKRRKRASPPIDAPIEAPRDEFSAIEPPPQQRRRSLWRYLTETPNRPPEHEETGKRGRGAFFKLLLWLIALAALFAFALYILPAGAFGSHDKELFSANNKLPDGYTHILLIGVDVDAAGTSRSDTMIVVSIGDGKLKLTSFMRDTGVAIPGRSGTHRLNAAYSFGGAELLVKTINHNFGLNITRYASIDYSGFSEIIDLLGGVEANVTPEEMVEVNRNMASNLTYRHQNGEFTYDEARKLFLKQELKVYGDKTHLSGLQALAYSRIRKIDSDYMRTQRQREVLSAAAVKLKGLVKKPVTLVRTFLSVKRLIKTNMGTLEIMSLGEKALFASAPETLRLPVTGTFTDDGGMFKAVDYRRNREEFIRFVYD